MPTRSLTGDLLGDLSQTLRMLQGSGMTTEEFIEIGNNSAMRDDVMVVMKKHKWIAEVDSLFSSPNSQVSQFRRFNNELWKDPAIEEAINSLGTPPECPKSDSNNLYCVSLMYRSGDLILDINRYWQACQYVHGLHHTDTDPHIKISPNTIRRYHEGHTPPLSLGWYLCELGRRYRGCNNNNTWWKVQRSGFRCMDHNAMLIAALNPCWAESINGLSVPTIVMGDLELSESERSPSFTEVPYLTRNHFWSMIVLARGERQGSQSTCGMGLILP